MGRVWRYRDLSMFWKLLLPFLTVLLVVGVFGAFLIVRELAGRAQADLNENLLRTSLETRSAVQSQELYLLESANLAANLQDMAAAVETRDEELVGQLLATVSALKTELDVLTVVDSSGVGILEVTAAGTVRGNATWRDTELLRRVLTGTVGDRQAGIERVAGRAHLAIAAPICASFDNCVPVGAAIVAVDLQALAAEVVVTTGPVDRGVAFLGPEGDVLATAGVASRQLVPSDPEGVVRGSATVGDVPVQTIQSPLELQGEPRGHVLISLPSEPVFASVRDAGLRLGLLLVVALAAIVLVGAALSRAIIRQVDGLVETNRRLGSGDLDARATIAGRDEIGELAAGLNQMADQLQASHENLEARVSQRTQEVERLLRERTDFFASISHELRTPLAIILSEADVLLEEAGDDPADAGRTIRTSAAQLLAVVNDILDLAKADAGKIELSVAPMRLHELVDEMRPTIAGLARAGEIEGSFDVPDDLPAVRGDWFRLREVLLNLVDNAVKYTPAGGSLGIAADAVADTVELRVWDTGIGIPEDVGEQLFEPFFRVKDSVPMHGRRSSGLGLALTRALVEAHGGTIDFAPRPGGGTVFTISLPIAASRTRDALSELAR